MVRAILDLIDRYVIRREILRMEGTSHTEGRSRKRIVCMSANDSAARVLRSEFQPGGSYCPWTYHRTTRRPKPKLLPTVVRMRRA